MIGLIRWPSLAAAVAVLTAGLSIGPAVAQVSSPRDVVGVWTGDDGQLKFEVFEVGEVYEARIIHNSRVMEADGRTFKADILNTDPALRSRSLKITVILSDMKWNPENLVPGMI